MSTLPPNSSVSPVESKQCHNQSDLNREQIKFALLSMFTMIIFSFLMFAPKYLPGRFVGIVLGVVPAIYMTWFLHSQPNALRNRRGSLVTAINLVAFLWIVAIAAVFAILTGVVK